MLFLIPHAASSAERCRKSNKLKAKQSKTILLALFARDDNENTINIFAFNLMFLHISSFNITLEDNEKLEN